MKNTVSGEFKGSSGESYVYTYDENSDLVIKRLLHGKLESFNDPTAGGSSLQLEPVTQGKPPGGFSMQVAKEGLYPATTEKYLAENSLFRRYNGYCIRCINEAENKEDCVQNLLHCEPTTEPAHRAEQTTEKEMVPEQGRFESLPGSRIDYFGVILPGTGLKPSTCVGWIPVGFCPGCGKIHVTRGNCKRSRCPDCHVSWRYDRAEGVFMRVWSNRLAENKRIRHFTLSPSPDTVEGIKSAQDIVDLFAWAYAYAKSKNVSGGVVILHPYRLREDMKPELYRIAVEEDNWTPGEFSLWKTLVKLPNWREYVTFYPHFHILATCKRGSRFKQGDGDDGVVWKGIGELRQAEDLLKCSMYLLSHAGVFTHKQVHAIRWFGDLSNCNWSLDQASPGVQAETIETFEGLVHAWAESEGVGFYNCPDCGDRWKMMSHAPEYFNDNRFSQDIQNTLRNAWLMYCGGIPHPPIDCTLDEFTEYLSKPRGVYGGG